MLEAGPATIFRAERLFFSPVSVEYHKMDLENR
jgi:hypothetical protein